MPEATWQPAVTNWGYSVEFLMVIIGRLQLLTESTVAPILPLLASPSLAGQGQTARLLLVVPSANLVGTFLAALSMAQGGVIPPFAMEDLLTVSGHYTKAACPSATAPAAADASSSSPRICSALLSARW
ncbi:MAG: formate/nitrite transporter family protein [Thiobacillus sp.]